MFDRFMAKVDEVLESEIGLTSVDLPDYHYWEDWALGYTPDRTAHLALEAAKRF